MGKCCLTVAVADPGLQIRGVGGGAVIQTLRYGGGGGGVNGIPKNCFWLFGPQIGLKIRGGGPLPWIHYRVGGLESRLRAVSFLLKNL